MKRGILVATLAVTVAGIAGAGLLTSTSHGVASSAQAAAPTVAPVQVPSAAAPVRTAEPKPASTVASPTVQKASLEVKQAPVPLLVKPRPAVNLPAVDAVAASTAPATVQQAAAPDASANPNEGVAKAAIEADGYKNVRAIRKGDNGVWYAKALRGKTEVTLVVDATGSVSAE